MNKIIFLTLFVSFQLLAINVSRGAEFIGYNESGFVDIEDNEFNVTLEGQSFDCVILDNRTSICLSGGKNYLLNTKITPQGIPESNFFNFVELIYESR